MYPLRVTAQTSSSKTWKWNYKPQNCHPVQRLWLTLNRWPWHNAFSILSYGSNRFVSRTKEQHQTKLSTGLVSWRDMEPDERRGFSNMPFIQVNSLSTLWGKVREFPVMAQWLTNLSGLRVWCCCELWCGSQMQLGSPVRSRLQLRWDPRRGNLNVLQGWREKERKTKKKKLYVGGLTAAVKSEKMFMGLSLLWNLPVANFIIAIFRVWLFASLS